MTRCARTLPADSVSVAMSRVNAVLVTGDRSKIKSTHADGAIAKPTRVLTQTYTVEPVQRAVFGRMLIEPEVIRMLLFGLALVLMMLFRPAGILPSAVRKREFEAKRNNGKV